jgi:hypothetical protein
MLNIRPGELEVLAVLKSILTSADAEIRIRTRVNRVHNMLGPERVDGLVLNIHRGVAYVAWPNGETTIESTNYLVPIVA